MPPRRLARLAPVVVVAIAAAVALPHSPAELRHLVLAAGVAAPLVLLVAWVAAGASSVRRSAFTAAIALGALLRTTPYALLGDGLATGSALPFIAAAASAAVGAALAALLLRHARPA